MSEDSDEESEVSLNTNLLDLPYHITGEICRHVDTSQELIKNLMAAVDGTPYQLDEKLSFVCLNPPPQNTPCQQLLMTLGSLGMTAQELVILLDKLRLEKPLMLLMEPTPLVLTLDIPLVCELDEGDTLQLDCRATGFPYPRYYWYRGQELVTHNTIGTLEITNIGLNDTGRYICRIHNCLKKRSEILWTTKCEVFVKEGLCKPLAMMQITEPTDFPRSIHFKRQPEKEVKAKHGESYELSLEAVGNPPLRYMWCKDEEIISRVSDSPVLRIKSMSYSDVGVYRCTVSNQDSEVKSQACDLNIVYPQPSMLCADNPVIISQPTDVKISLNGVVVFQVKAQSTRRLHYQWFHNGRTLTHDTSKCSGCLSYELRFVVEQRNQEGLYQCMISTDPGPGGTVQSRQAKLRIDHNTKGSAYYATDKIAIILGQSTYRSNNKELPAVKNDVYEAHNVFTQLGFKCISGLDNTLKEMHFIIDYAIDMMRSPKNNQLYVVLYVVGHGFRYHGVSYLMPSSAVEGTQLSNCLSMDEVEKKITKELNPALLFLIPDVCQQLVIHVLSDTKSVNSSKYVCKNKLVCGVATPGEESNEEQLPASFRRETSTGKIQQSVTPPQDDPGWRNITSQRTIRGIFSKDFFRLLVESGHIIIQDIYKGFNDIFVRPNPNLLATKGKEQNPIFEINIEAERSLLDPVNPQGQEEEYEKRKAKYDAITSMPPDFLIPLRQLPNWSLKGSFKVKNSNVLELLMYEEDRRPDHKQGNISYNILAQSVPLSARPNEYYQYDDDLDNGIKQKRGYIFYNLQKLQAPINVRLDVKFSSPPYIESYGLVAGYPLISETWKLSCVPQQRFMQQSYSREACEHSEGDDKLSSLESYA